MRAADYYSNSTPCALTVLNDNHNVVQYVVYNKL